VAAMGLTKDFNGVRAVDGVGFRVEAGEIFGLFGPNGAGKSTTLRMLTATIEPSAGTATVCGQDVKLARDAVRDRVSILPEHVAAYSDMRPLSYLRFSAGMSGLDWTTVASKAEDLLRELELPAFDKRIGTLSMGQRQRLEIARVLLEDRELLILDEPFNAVDLDMRRRLMERFRERVRTGASILYTSHHLLEAEKFVDRFGFLRAGRLAAIGTSADLKSRYLDARYRIRVGDPERARKLLSGLSMIPDVSVDDGYLCVTVRSREDIADVVRLLVENRHAVTEVTPSGSLEDLFDRLKEDARAQ
ncbi:MAG TPA: ABC transporter ATP-binding protein, partial [Burkholderiales bacterium]|nr:ABC transporter ATP-binding protein [Burkholderiales bacterium]